MDRNGEKRGKQINRMEYIYIYKEDRAAAAASMQREPARRGQGRMKITLLGQAKTGRIAKKGNLHIWGFACCVRSARCCLHSSRSAPTADLKNVISFFFPNIFTVKQKKYHNKRIRIHRKREKENGYRQRQRANNNNTNNGGKRQRGCCWWRR